jgi:SAM-dependent methyltransferase
MARRSGVGGSLRLPQPPGSPWTIIPGVPDPGHVDSARRVYDLAASRYVDFVGTEINAATEAPIDRSLLMAFVELVQGGPSGPVADIGCGPGRVAAFLVHHGLDVVGVDVSEGMLAAARRAHPHIRFEKGELAALPFEPGALAGAAYWYSIIYTPPDELSETFAELGRVLVPGGHALFGFQTGSGEPVRRATAHGTNLPLTNYLHNPSEVAAQLEEVGLTIYAQVVRAPDLEHETTSQGFIVARRPAG